MITLMRRYRKSLQVGLLFVVAAFVASLFVFGTRGFDGDGSPDTVATVNGERIPLERYQRRYQAYYDAYAQIYRERFSSELAERLGLAQQVVNDLVQETLVVQRARAEGLELSDEELNARVQAVPAFQEGGRFVLKRYEEFLRRRGLGAAAFEEDIRRELTRARVEAAVRGGVKVSEVEIEQAFAMRREEVRAAWALVDLGPLVAAATATDAELQDYLAKHGDEFRQPERRRVQYVLLAQKDFAKPVPEAEAERYYAAHPKEFESPRQVRAAHVLARVPETGGSAAEDTARAKIADVIRRAKAGEDFAKLAKELSEDPGSAPNGGDLGLVSPGEVVPQFEQALFALKKGEVSAEPVRTPFGFHAIKALDVRAGGRKPLKDVAAAIRERRRGRGGGGAGARGGAPPGAPGGEGLRRRGEEARPHAARLHAGAQRAARRARRRGPARGRRVRGRGRRGFGAGQDADGSRRAEGGRGAARGRAPAGGDQDQGRRRGPAPEGRGRRRGARAAARHRRPGRRLRGGGEEGGRAHGGDAALLAREAGREAAR